MSCESLASFLHGNLLLSGQKLYTKEANGVVVEVAPCDFKSPRFGHLAGGNHFRERRGHCGLRRFHGQPVRRRDVDLSGIRERIGAEDDFFRKDFQPALQNVAVLLGRNQQAELGRVEINVG
jgi:hypothetical protein